MTRQFDAEMREGVAGKDGRYKKQNKIFFVLEIQDFVAKSVSSLTGLSQPRSERL